MTTATDEEFEKAMETWLGSTGATRLQTFRVENNDIVDVEIWIAVARWADDDYRVAADTSRARAMAVLCSDVGTDGICLECMKPTVFEPVPEMTVLYDPERFCVTTFDYETLTFVRSCDTNH